MKLSKIIPLSKDTTAFPAVGNIRPIAIAPCLTKLYEQVILTRLTSELDASSHRIHPKQRGFTMGKSTFTNIADVCDFSDKARA